ncbi:UNVERIFIED_CONTAM: hypothetical protein K2H54_015921 [Gekko kuhli]
MREKVCREFNSIGKDRFRAGAIIASSRKYSNATFEEIVNVVKELVSIAEKCCPEGVDPNCYENESLALSARSCRDPAPFPKHPGLAACCTEEGLEQKLCLAALKHPTKEFPTYVEPSNDEVCEAFTRDPQDFQDRYLYEYSADYSSAPLPVLVASTTSYLSMVATCCASTTRTPCFLKERLSRKSLAVLTHMSNIACARYDLLGKEKTELSFIVKLAQKSPSASLEDVVALATDASEILSRTCNATDNDAIHREFLEHTAKVCSRLSAKDQRFAHCCTEGNTMKTYFCLYSLPWAQPPSLPDFQKPADEVLCTEKEPQEAVRYIFEIARRFSNAPEALFFVIRESTRNILANCCKEADPKACLGRKRPQARQQIFDLLSKGNELCSQYTNLTFLEFKKKLRETYSKALPEATEEVLSGLVEQKANFASTCCLLNAPLEYCRLKVRDEVSHTCSQDVCLLH